MSASTSFTNGNSASSAGTGTALCAIKVRSPTVFSVTVLPPVFGPLISNVRSSPESSSEIGDHPLALLSKNIFEQRVPRLPQNKPWRVRRAEARNDAVKRARKAGLGKYEFELAHDFDSHRDVARHRAETFRHLPEYAVDLASFLFHQANQFVIQGNRFEWLDK